MLKTSILALLMMPALSFGRMDPKELKLFYSGLCRPTAEHSAELKKESRILSKRAELQSFMKKPSMTPIEDIEPHDNMAVASMMCALVGVIKKPMLKDGCVDEEGQPLDVKATLSFCSESFPEFN